MTLSNIEGYGISFQTKVISALLTDKPFLQNINDVLTEEYHNYDVDHNKYYPFFKGSREEIILKIKDKYLDESSID